MTIKLVVEVEPVDETVRVLVTRKRETEKVPYVVEFMTPTALRSQTVEVEIGDELSVMIEPVGKIMYDKDQFSVHVEDINSPEQRKVREEKKKEVEKGEEDLKKEREIRAKEAERIEKENVKKAKEAEAPVANVPFPAPLPKEEVGKAHEGAANSPVPPKGGAKDSKEVKG